MLNIGGTNPWDTPNGNGALLEKLLQIPRTAAPLTSIAQAKEGEEGQLVHIRGYVTAGTAVEATRFPGCIYLQDDTGGICVEDFTANNVPLGKPLELYLLRQGNRFLLQHWRIWAENGHLYQPQTVTIPEVGSRQDMLVKVEGKVVSRVLTPDEKGVRALALEAADGSRVNIRIEDTVSSASTGKNTLASVATEGGWVSVVGIVYSIDGQTVLRVRNCDEILAIRETGIAYPVVKGEYTLWIRKDGQSVYIEIEAPGSDFLYMEVDGQRVDKSNYQTTEGTNLTFRIWPRYLRTLELGYHNVVFKFRDGDAVAELVVWNDADSPQTGEYLVPFLGLMTICGPLILWNIRRRKMQR